MAVVLGVSRMQVLLMLVPYLVLWLSLSVLPVTGQLRCDLVRADGHSDQQPLNPSIPSPSISPITNISSTNSPLPTRTSSTQPQPSSTPFVYGRDKIRGVNLCVIPRYPAFPFVPGLIVPI